MRRHKKLVALMLVVAMLIMASLSGCGSKNATGVNGEYVMDDVLNPLGSDVICKEKVTLEFMMGNNGAVSDYDSNKYTLELERKGNVDIQFNLVPGSDLQTKVNLVLSSGKDLPDVINTTLDSATIATYGSAGLFVPLNNYYANSSEYLAPQIETLKQDIGLNIYDYITMSDGNIYGIVKYNESLQNEIPHLLWINKAWLAKAGMEVPKTIDEFVAALKYFKTHDMNGNGKSDEIAMVDYTKGGLLELIENAYVKTGVDSITIKDDGTLDMAYATDGYKEYLKFMNKLYSEGLLDTTTFSQDKTTFQTLLNAETTIVGVFAATSTSMLSAGSARRENHEYAPMFVDNTSKPGYNTFRYMQTMPEQGMFITTACEHPEVAFRIADYMCSEEMTVWSRWGEKGTDWLEPTSSTVGMYEFMGYPAYLEPVLPWGPTQNSHWQNGTPGFRRTNVSLGMSSNDASQVSKSYAINELYNRYGKDFVNDVKDQRVYKLVYSETELSEMSDITAAINPYVTQMRYEFITGKQSIDSGWDSYIKELKGLNIDRLVEINNTAYNRMKNK